MGSSNTSEKIYERGFDQVDSKCEWSRGLTVNVQGRPLLKVVDIRAAVPELPRLRISGNKYIYIYTGSRVNASHNMHGSRTTAYEITLMPVVKTGSAEPPETDSESDTESAILDKDSVESDDISALDFTKGKFRIRVVPCSELRDNIL